MGMLIDEFRVLVFVDGDETDLGLLSTILYITVKKHRVDSVRGTTPDRIRGIIGVVTTGANFTDGPDGVLCIFYSLKSTPNVVRIGDISAYRSRGLQWLSMLSVTCAEPIDDINDVLKVMEFV